MNLRMMQWAALLAGILCACPAPVPALQTGIQREQPAVMGESMALLASSVKELGLGQGAFVIGSYLTKGQVEQAQGTFLADTYLGTIKFSSGNVVIVADEKTKLILAIYQRRENILAYDVKQMVGYLMTSFGEPTTIAHGKLLYWAFGKAGKVEEQAYNDSKAVGNIDILATVKFSSTLGLNPGMTNENMEGKGTIYYIITSDQLLDRYITSP